MLSNPFVATRSKLENRNHNNTRFDSGEEIPEETIGQALFGVNIKILYEDSPEYYRDDIEFSTLGLVDGSRRRISYIVC
jgi:hypothetical protein